MYLKACAIGLWASNVADLILNEGHTDSSGLYPSIYRNYPLQTLLLTEHYYAYL